MIPVTPLQKRVDTITSECRSTTQRAEALARQLESRDTVIRELRDSLKIFILEGWRRHCWVCDSPRYCQHREADLVKRWESGELR